MEKNVTEIQNKLRERENIRTGREVKWLVEEAERKKKKRNITISGLSIIEPEKLKDWLKHKL